jgi:hypothetical protein
MRRGEVPFVLVVVVAGELAAGERPFVLVLLPKGNGWAALEERREDETERREPVVRARRPSVVVVVVEKSEGRSEVGKGGEETKSDAIWISAVSTSGEPRTAFCSVVMP